MDFDHRPGGQGSQAVKIVYIAGSGRSGSTLLERILNEQGPLHAIGEIVDIWRDGLLHNDRCGCGEPFMDCPFWAQVGRLSFGGWEKVDLTQTMDLKKSVERQRFFPQLIAKPLFPTFSNQVGDYLGLLKRIYKAAQSVSGAQWLIDSSKWPIHALLLRQIPEFDLKIIHLVRDPRGVAYSWQKKGIERPHSIGGRKEMRSVHPAKTAFNWTIHHLEIHLLEMLGIPVIRLKYEDLVRDPFGAVMKIFDFLSIDQGTAIRNIGLGSVNLRSGHGIGGNPVRFHHGEIVLRLDAAWREGLTLKRKKLVELLTAPLMIAYGFLGKGFKDARSIRDENHDDIGSNGAWPDVSVVIPTRNRPVMVQRAIETVIGQDYPGSIECIVVFDHSEPETSLERSLDGRQVKVLRNIRSPGIAGARNTGIAASSGELIAFCDDDDEWIACKLGKQVEFLKQHPNLNCVASGIYLSTPTKLIVRTPRSTSINHTDLLKSRLMEIHPSSLLLRADLIKQVGPVDEVIPGGYGEDYDLLLRIARQSNIGVIQEPLVIIRWNRTSWFQDNWHFIDLSIDYLTGKHHEFKDCRQGLSRLLSRKAIAKAVLGQRKSAVYFAIKSIILSPKGLRPYLSLLIALGIWDVHSIQRVANDIGRSL